MILDDSLDGQVAFIIMTLYKDIYVLLIISTATALSPRRENNAAFLRRMACRVRRKGLGHCLVLERCIMSRVIGTRALYRAGNRMQQE
jgi:hypothetical protein